MFGYCSAFSVFLSSNYFFVIQQVLIQPSPNTVIGSPSNRTVNIQDAHYVINLVIYIAFLHGNPIESFQHNTSSFTLFLSGYLSTFLLSFCHLCFLLNTNLF